MGSEHYCLRWNNHQSNLLGVFSQLLQDESLVDVTLSCSEGAPIRAHKVVLSACSSYFQSLFLDHPERHPIVILKDVRFAELQTLVEFMYKGEVNVQYCQLSALLKTAESLKVKGLAEMTNQNTSLREPEREPDRLRTQPSKNTCNSPVDAALAAGPSSTTSSATTPTSTSSSCSTVGTTIAHTLVDSNAAVASAAAAAAASSALVSTVNLSSKAASSSASTSGPHQAGSHKRERERESSSAARCSATPPKRASTIASIESRHSPLPLDLYQRRIEPAEEASERTHTHIEGGARELSPQPGCSNTDRGKRSPTPHSRQGGGGADHRSGNVHHDNGDDHDRTALSSPKRSSTDPDTMGVGSLEKIEEADDYDEEMDLEEEDGDLGDVDPDPDADADDNSSSNEVGLNMKISGCGVVGIMGHASMMAAISSPLDGGGGGGIGVDVESARSTPAVLSSMPSDLSHRPASRSSRDGGGGGPGTARTPTERPSSSGVCGTTTGGLSPSSSSLAAVGGATIKTESLSSATTGLGPVQSVPLSLKKEIECSEDDNSSSRHMLQPRLSSAGGGLGSEMDYRASHESETSESPHPSGGGGANATTLMGGAGSALEQPQTPPPIYPCVYCGAAFPNQSKLTRHILSHSLKTLEYRETATHALLHPHLLPHDLNMTPLPQQFAYQINALAASSGDPQEQAAAVAAAAAAIEMDFAAAVAAAGGCALTGMGSSCGSGSRSGGGLDLDSGGVGRGGGSSRDNNCGLGSSSSCGLLTGAGASSSSTSAAAVAASTSAAAALLGSSPGSASATSDPNSVVLCKFCGKSFPDVASLITHLPVHTGDRPFKCEFCGKAFKLRHHMKDHCRVHTGERPFRCSMCGKTFSRSTILKAHEKTHFPKYVRKYLSPSPVDTKDELPQ